MCILDYDMQSNIDGMNEAHEFVSSVSTLFSKGKYDNICLFIPEYYQKLFDEVGNPGIVAAQMIIEPVSQESLSSFHNVGSSQLSSVKQLEKVLFVTKSELSYTAKFIDKTFIMLSDHVTDMKQSAELERSPTLKYSSSHIIEEKIKNKKKVSNFDMMAALTLVEKSTELMEVYKVFGIEAAHIWIMKKLVEIVPGVSEHWVSLIADMICLYGIPVPLSSSGPHHIDINIEDLLNFEASKLF